MPRSGLQGPDGAEGVGLPSFSSCPHVLEVTVQLDPGLRTRVPGQGPASSWGLDLGAPFLSISYSRATPTAGVRVRVTAAHAGLRGLTQAWCWSGADSPAPPSLQNFRTTRGGRPWILLFHPHFTSPHQVHLGPMGCAGPWPVSRGFWQASPKAPHLPGVLCQVLPREPQVASDLRSALGHRQCRQRGP